MANVDGSDGNELLVHLSDFNRSTFLVIDVDAQDEFLPAIETRMRAAWNLQAEIDANGDGISDFIGVSDGKTQTLGRVFDRSI